MLIRRHTKNYNFVADSETGFTFRWGKNFSENPIMAPWPELADISISNYCLNNCEYCYRKSNPKGKCITLKDYSFLLGQLSCPEFGAVFQVALGGGEPLLHPEFIEILKITKEVFGIIPNYTTNGKFFDEATIEATKKWCGAIAISYDPYRVDISLEEIKKIGLLLKDKGIKANIHYVLSKKTLEDAIKVLNDHYEEFLYAYNAIIFLTYKPMGQANRADCLNRSDLLNSFLRLIDKYESKLKIGFDACMVPIVMKYTSIDHDFLDSCECGFFSVYIDENLNVKPCSFCDEDKYSFNLRKIKFKDIWLNKFSEYRKNIASNCSNECEVSNECRGKCPFFEELFLC